MTLQPKWRQRHFGNRILATVVSTSQKVTTEGVSKEQHQEYTTAGGDPVVYKENVFFDRG